MYRAVNLNFLMMSILFAARALLKKSNSYARQYMFAQCQNTMMIDYDDYGDDDWLGRKNSKQNQNARNDSWEIFYLFIYSLFDYYFLLINQ